MIKRQRLLMVLLTVVASMNLKAQTLVLHHPDGNTTHVELYTQPRIEFQGDRVFITSTVLYMDYDKRDILSFTYKGSTLGISNLKEKPNVSQENGQIVFHGIKSTDKISVHTLKGIRIPIRMQQSGSTATLPLSAIPSGAYLLTVNGRTSKFTKR